MSKGYTLDQICERISSTRFRRTCEKEPIKTEEAIAT